MVCSAGLLSADLSLTAAGGAFRVRLRVDVSPVDGVAQFDPTRGNRSFSYSFGANTTDGNHTVDAQWRSVTGDRVALKDGLLTMQFFHCTP